MANLIELIPKQTPIKVSTLGKIYLDLFTETTFNLFFFPFKCSQSNFHQQSRSVLT